MWLICGGKISKPVSQLLTGATGLTYQSVSNVLDITNTIFERGLDSFNNISGVVVLPSGTESIIDVGWLLQLNRLEVPIYYYTNLDVGEDIKNLEYIHVKYAETPFKVLDIAKDIMEGSL